MALTTTRRAALEANIPKYYVLRTFLKRLVWPILTIFLLRNQLSLAELGTIFSVGTLIGLILEVPSGAMADWMGRRNAMTVAMLLQAISMLLFAVGDSFTIFLIANALYYGAGSLLSGTHEALMYETLTELGRQDDIKRITGRALFWSQVSTGIVFVFVPLLATVSLVLPFYLNAVQFLIGALIAYSFVEPQRAVSVKQTESGSDALGFRSFFSNRALLVGGLFFALIGGLGGFLDDFRQAYLDLIHVDLAYFGIVYLFLRVFTGVGGLYTERIEAAIGRRAMLVILFGVTAVAYMGMFLVNTLYGLLFIVLDGIEAGFSRPLEQEYLNSRINHRNRATLLSVFSFFEGLIRAIFVFIAGLVAHKYGLQAGFGLAALVLLLTAGPLLIAMLRQEPSLSPKPDLQ